MVPVFACTAPRAAASAACPERAVDARDRERGPERSAQVDVLPTASRSARERMRGEAIGKRQPRAVDDAHAGERHAGLRRGHGARSRRRPRVEPPSPTSAPIVFSTISACEVVALAVHLHEHGVAARTRLARVRARSLARRPTCGAGGRSPCVRSSCLKAPRRGERRVAPRRGGRSAPGRRRAPTAAGTRR